MTEYTLNDRIRHRAAIADSEARYGDMDVFEEALARIETLEAAALDVVHAYQEAIPLRTADMHPAKCGCLRCEVDRLDHVAGSR